MSKIENINFMKRPPDFHAEVIHLLKTNERKQKFTVLFSVETGPRVINIHSPDTPYQIIFVYKYPYERYLELFNPEVDFKIDYQHPYQIQGIGIKKFFTLIHQSSQFAHEVVNSTQEYYGSNPGLRRTLREYLYERVNYSNLHSYYRKQGSNYFTFEIRGKKQVLASSYLNCFYHTYAARYIEKFEQLPPISIEDLFTELGIKNRALWKLVRLKQKNKHNMLIDGIHEWNQQLEVLLYQRVEIPALEENKEENLEILNRLLVRELVSLKPSMSF